MKAHLIGIGGAGVSAAAKHLACAGYEISGSDDTYSEIIRDMEENYTLAYVGVQSADNISEDIDLVIYTPAVGPGNVEYERARLLEIPVLSYPEYLGVIAKDMKTVAVAGTNGKTTTTTMTAEVLIDQDFDPTVIIGAKSKKLDSNYRKGSSNLFIVEACEYKNSFLSLTPDVLVITNITPDHLDFFKTVEEYTKAFKNLVEKMSPDSVLIYNGSDELSEEVVGVARERGLKLIDYETLPELELTIGGRHNVFNAQAALAVVQALDGEIDKAMNYLSTELQGAKRRLENKGITSRGDIVIDDYAHNPEGLVLLIDGLERQYPGREIVVFFQPHLFSRTSDLLHEFARALAVAHTTVLLPIYGAREEDPGNISSEILAETISLIDETLTPTVVKDFKEAVSFYGELDTSKEYVLVTVGAGDVYEVGEDILVTYSN